MQVLMAQHNALYTPLLHTVICYIVTTRIEGEIIK